MSVDIVNRSRVPSTSDLDTSPFGRWVSLNCHNQAITHTIPD
jgi:hypothetical protein